MRRVESWILCFVGLTGCGADGRDPLTSEVIEITAPALAEGLYFGSSLALRGERLAVGAPRLSEVPPPGGEAGAVLVFERSAEGDFVLDAALQPRATWMTNQQLSLDPDRLLVRAPFDDGCEGTALAGAIFVYLRGDEGWSQADPLCSPEPVGGGAFGEGLVRSAGRVAALQGSGLDASAPEQLFVWPADALFGAPNAVVEWSSGQTYELVATEQYVFRSTAWDGIDVRAWSDLESSVGQLACPSAPCRLVGFDGDRVLALGVDGRWALFSGSTLLTEGALETTEGPFTIAARGEQAVIVDARNRRFWLDADAPELVTLVEDHDASCGPPGAFVWGEAGLAWACPDRGVVRFLPVSDRPSASSPRAG